MNKDVLLIVLSKINNQDLLNICQVNKYFSNLCNNENLWRNKLWKEYRKIYPEENQTWKNMYLKLVYYMNKNKYEKTSDSFLDSIEDGHLEVVKYLSTLIDINPVLNFEIVTCSSYHGNLNIVIFLSTLPEVDFSIQDYAIQTTSQKGYLEVVKFLSTLPNVDPSAGNNYAIQRASYYGHIEVVKYLSALPVVNKSIDYEIVLNSTQKYYLTHACSDNIKNLKMIELLSNLYEKQKYEDQ